MGCFAHLTESGAIADPLTDPGLSAPAVTAPRGERPGCTARPATAQAMNEAFRTPIGRPDAFAAGEIFGSVGFTAEAE